MVLPCWEANNQLPTSYHTLQTCLDNLWKQVQRLPMGQHFAHQKNTIQFNLSDKSPQTPHSAAGIGVEACRWREVWILDAPGVQGQNSRGSLIFNFLWSSLMKINPISRLVGASERLIACVSINNMGISVLHKTFLPILKGKTWLIWHHTILGAMDFLFISNALRNKYTWAINSPLRRKSYSKLIFK